MCVPTDSFDSYNLLLMPANFYRNLFASYRLRVTFAFVMFPCQLQIFVDTYYKRHNIKSISKTRPFHSYCGWISLMVVTCTILCLWYWQNCYNSIIRWWRNFRNCQSIRRSSCVRSSFVMTFVYIVVIAIIFSSKTVDADF